MSTRSFAYLALIGFGVRAVAFLSLHALRTDYDPTVHFVSEYAIGPYSWILVVGVIAGVAGTLALMGGLESASLAPAPSAPFVLLSIHVAMRLSGLVFPIDPIEAAFVGGGAPEFTIGGWIHAISGMIAAISVTVAILLLTIRLVTSGRLSGWYRSLALWAVLGPASYVFMLATQPATFPAGLYQRLFIVCTWLWLVVTCGGLISGSLTGGIADREAQTT